MIKEISIPGYIYKMEFDDEGSYCAGVLIDESSPGAIEINPSSIRWLWLELENINFAPVKSS